MLLTAELSAGSQVGAGVICRKPYSAVTAWDQVDLAAKLRDPEVLNDIGGFEAELHMLPVGM